MIAKQTICKNCGKEIAIKGSIKYGTGGYVCATTDCFKQKSHQFNIPIKKAQTSKI